ncbi:hypothetical protein EYC84_002342 [Monilinia fructicola]|uniref:Ribosomal protein S8 n=1 Tax=Monilinia fructicola TaxID=38448 RepID=A0A5M9JKK1_MONFR|nr:hypothetical protein EYC84_002342 [Monilinia fructicola]
MEPMRDWIEVMKCYCKSLEAILIKTAHHLLHISTSTLRHPWSISAIVPARACDSVLETSNPYYVSRNSCPRSFTSPKCLKSATWTYVCPLFEHDPHSYARLQSSGFLSSVTRGGLTPPPMDELSTYVPEPVTQRNISTRRLWLGLKYWNNEPVLSHMSIISKPTKRIWMDVEGLSNLVRGRDANFVRGLRKPGECIYISTSSGIMEARECVERRIGISIATSGDKSPNFDSKTPKANLSMELETYGSPAMLQYKK